MLHHLLPPRCGGDPHIVLLEIVANHLFHDRIVFDDEDAPRLIVGHANAQVGLAKCPGSVPPAPVEVWDDLIVQMARAGCFTIHRNLLWGNRNWCQIAYLMTTL